jgi:hypothetical protein
MVELWRIVRILDCEDILWMIVASVPSRLCATGCQQRILRRKR